MPIVKPFMLASTCDVLCLYSGDHVRSLPSVHGLPVSKQRILCMCFSFSDPMTGYANVTASYAQGQIRGTPEKVKR
jgi:hypothetical protein